MQILLNIPNIKNCCNLIDNGRNQLVNDAQLVVRLIGQKSEITLLILRGNNQMFVTLSIN